MKSLRIVVALVVVTLSLSVSAAESDRSAGSPPKFKLPGSYQWLASPFCTLSEAGAFAASIDDTTPAGTPVIVPTRDAKPRHIVFYRQFVDFYMRPAGLSWDVVRDPNVATQMLLAIEETNKGQGYAANGEIIVWKMEGTMPCQ